MSKKEFAERLIQLEVKLKNTGSVPSENTIYAYLNGRIGIKIELIPYIAEVLNIPEQLLFDDSARARKIFLKYLAESITSEEKEFLKAKVCEDKITSSVPKDRFYAIQDLLIYAPDVFLNELERTLKEYKDLTLKFRK
ncbi:hypothetical protein [Sulfurimonas sp. RIFCSPLOWO2_12_36_12]|uniref:hypothetical protein n=1 Tax=Sulfurimonas sp. RIFCSPLOWO2_12_36_12 TaxID=1802253 RepID=UPI0025FD17EE|nr:hypothetical protein [Sulfurimonas sp. RIFCSPLOWO2_12_36_12]